MYYFLKLWKPWKYFKIIIRKKSRDLNEELVLFDQFQILLCFLSNYTSSFQTVP